MTGRAAILILAAAILSFRGAAEAKEAKERAARISTYIGPVAGIENTNVSFKDWGYISTQSYNNRGMLYAGGARLMIAGIHYFAGDFSIQYAFSPAPNIHRHLLFTIMARVAVPLGEIAYLTVPGVGLYFETPPSSDRRYLGGAGFAGCLGVGFHVTREQEREGKTYGTPTILFIEGYARYGWYRRGCESSRISYGGSVGFLVKVGTL